MANRSIFTLKYEDLVTAPETTIQAMFDHLGEETPAGFVQKVFDRPLEHGPLHIGQGDPGMLSGMRNRFDPSSIGRWRSLNQHLVRSVADLVNPGLACWGYQTV